MNTHDTLTAHAVNTPAAYVAHGAPSALDDRFARSAPSAPDPLAPIDWRTLATFTAHAAEIVDTATERRDRVAADGTAPGPLAHYIRAVVEVIATRADRLARADHSWWHGHVTRGDTDPAAPAPDPFSRVRAETIRETSNRGVTVQRVTVHGRAMVGGDVHAERSPALAMTPDRLAHAIRTAPRTALGHTDAVALARLTDAAYPDLPRLIGGDVLTFHEWRETGAVRIGKPRPVRRPSRVRLPRIVPRTGEPSTRGTGALLAPSDDPAMAWRGHVLTPRPATVRQRRADRARPAPTETVAIRDRDALAPIVREIASAAAPGDRIGWRWRGLAGHVTVSGSPDRPRLAITGLPVKVSGHRTAQALARAVDRATPAGPPAPAA